MNSGYLLLSVDCKKKENMGSFNSFKVKCVRDFSVYKKGIKETEDELNAINIIGNAFHPEGNYIIHPDSIC